KSESKVPRLKSLFTFDEHITEFEKPVGRRTRSESAAEVARLKLSSLNRLGDSDSEDSDSEVSEE
ncbi:Hypothetical predicted protein, partial [Paramuricea clavata]